LDESAGACPLILGPPPIDPIRFGQSIGRVPAGTPVIEARLSTLTLRSELTRI
jgi:hypothetical protein